MFVSRMVSLWCQSVWILWYSYFSVQDGLPVMSNCMNIVIFLCLYPGWPRSDVKLYEYCDILMFVSRIVSLWCHTVWILWDSYVCLRMVSLWCQSVWILWYSFVCVQDGLSVMSNCMNIMIFLCLCPGWSPSDVKLFEYCNILMFVSRMVSLWCQTVWILWYSYVCGQGGLLVMSNCMNIVIFLCLCPGWSLSDVKLYEYCDILMFVSRMVSQWCQTVWILWYSYVCVQHGVSVMSNCMNVVIFLCLCPGWSLSDVKLYEYCHILMFVSRMVSHWCQTVWILWYSCLCPGWYLCDVKLYEYCDILVFVSRVVSVLCQTVWILWYSFVCLQDGLTVMSNCKITVIFLCLYPGWSLSDVKLYEYCDILMFVSSMVSYWCQTVWILWYSYVCLQDGFSVMSNCLNIVIFLCLCPGWSLCDVKLYEYYDILMFVGRVES